MTLWPAIIRLRVDAEADWSSNNTVLKSGEPGIESDTRRIKVGDGSSAWSDLDYVVAAADVGTATGVLPIANGGTNATSASGARTSLGLGSMATQAASSVAISGGAIDGTVIGGSTPAAGKFTDLYWNGASGFTSDRRLKKNIKKLDAETCLKGVMKLKPVSFTRIGGTGVELGFIAQEVKKCFPEAVSQVRMNGKLVWVLSSMELVAPLVSVIQTQKMVIDDLEKRIGKLEDALF